jgi:hypothetical protein
MPDMPVDFFPGPPYPKAMEARIAVLEHIAKTTAATLERLEQRQDHLLDRMDRRFDSMEAKFDAKFESVDRRFETMDRKFEAKFEIMDQRWVTLSTHHRQDFLWMTAIQVATVGGLLTAMARGFHWL